ncbi:PAS domain-containing protein [Rubellimicrobium roseum]|uniref:histidine kinase n=1 Tax=Rubellimicrobium roseum TaxID=687525 RepID=A0A5C4NG29_9RHOB|nr:PAS domain-containing protein [Rubellimicrobium roseum]TNC72016.1 PAS domain S-box protein [Rubellimicrobium roseum]
MVAGVVSLLAVSAALVMRAGRLDSEARLTRDRHRRDARIAAMVDGVGLGTWQRDLEARIVDYGHGCRELLGHEPDEMPRDPAAWGGMVHPADRAVALAGIEPHLAGRTPFFRCEYRVRHKDGRWVWILDSGRVVERDAKGQPRVVAGAFLDITARKEAEEALRASEELNRRILSASPDCIKLLSLDGRLEFFSEGGLCAMEVDDFDRQLRDVDWISFWTPEDRPRVREAIAAALAGGTGRFQAFCPTARGTPKWWDVSVTVIAGADGAPERLLSVSRDITRQHASEERLALLAQAAERLLVSGEPAAMVEGVYGLIAEPLALDVFFNYRLDESGSLLLAAHAGLTEAAVRDGARLELGQAVCGCVARDRRPAHVARVQDSDDPLHAFIRGQGLTAYACTPLMVDGTLLGTLGFGRRSGRPFTDEDIAFLQTVCHYVAVATERARAEAALRSFNAVLEARVTERTGALEEAALSLQAEMRRRETAQSQLLQAQKMEALGRLVGGVAHDFNNILAAVQGAFAILDRRIDDPKLGFVIEQGQKAGERAGALVRGMLAFARRKPLEPKVVDPAAMVGELEGMIRHAAGAKVDCGIEVAPGTWPVLVDPNQFEVALLNLAINARDAMTEGGRLRVSARNLGAAEPRPEGLGPGDLVVVAVADTGCGMDEAKAARIFEPFYTTKDPGQGTGLGLSQVHGFAHGAGGTVTVDSAPGRGTTMRIYLPRSAVEPVDAATEAAVAPELHGRAAILLVDDDDQVRPVTAAYLRELGYEVVEAAGGAAAQGLAQSHAIDLLLTDVVMPGIDGPELVRRMRAERADLPVLFMTGYSGVHALEGEAVVGKPFSGPELGLHVLRALGRIEPKGVAL